MPMQRLRIAAFASRRIDVGARSWRTPGFGPVVSERSASIRLLLLAGRRGLGRAAIVRPAFMAHGYRLMTSGPRFQPRADQCHGAAVSARADYAWSMGPCSPRRPRRRPEARRRWTRGREAW